MTQNMIEYLQEMQNPINHIPSNLGINDFKKVVGATSLPKQAKSKLIRAYKRRSWMEFEAITRQRGTWSSHPTYGKSIKVTDNSKEYEINVNAKQSA